MEWPEVLMQPSITPSELRAAFRAALLESPLIETVSEVANEPLMLDAWKLSDGRPIRIDISRLNHDVARCEPAVRLRQFQNRLDCALEVAGLPDGELAGSLREQLIPTIKNRHWHATVSERCGEPLAAVGLVGELVVVYARDRASGYSFLSMEALEREGITIAEAEPLALANLRARLPRDLSTRGDGNSFIFTAGGNFEASLILLPEIWDNLATQLPGDIVVCVLARDLLFVTATGIPDGIPSVTAACRRAATSMNPADLISPALFLREHGKWVVP